MTKSDVPAQRNGSGAQFASRPVRRLRLLAIHERTLAAELAKVRAEQVALENAVSHSIGFAVPLRGRRLFDEIDRAETARRKAKVMANG